MNKAIEEYLNKHGFEAFCPKAVLFDMDGVLYNSMPNHAIAWQQSMAQFGINMTHEQAYATEGQRGIDTIKQMVQEQQGRRIYTKTAQRMYDVKTHIFHQMAEPPVMPGAKELMEKISSVGITICVVTGSGQRPLIQRLLRDFGQYLKQEYIVTAYDVKKGKPFPDPYLMGLEKAGMLKPWEAIVVENAPLGVQAGVAANIFTICVNTGKLPENVFQEKGVNIIYDSMLSLCEAWDPDCFMNK
ncbi:MAG: HAD hydrolase-like protein [Prevotella sp.]|nr:HAD hydrolase-like protein [Prevotella sp.]